MGCKAHAEPACGAAQMKKVLSANADAGLSVESIMEDVDVRGKMSRTDFEAMSAPILDRVRGPLQQVCLCVFYVFASPYTCMPTAAGSQVSLALHLVQPSLSSLTKMTDSCHHT